MESAVTPVSGGEVVSDEKRTWVRWVLLGFILLIVIVGSWWGSVWYRDQQPLMPQGANGELFDEEAVLASQARFVGERNGTFVAPNTTTPFEGAPLTNDSLSVSNSPSGQPPAPAFAEPFVSSDPSAPASPPPSAPPSGQSPAPPLAPPFSSPQ